MNWRESELGGSIRWRAARARDSRTLRVEIHKLAASIAQLAEQVAELTMALEALDAAMAKATKIRPAEKAKKRGDDPGRERRADRRGSGDRVT